MFEKSSLYRLFAIGDGSGDGSFYGAGPLAIIIGAAMKLLRSIFD